MPQRLFMDAGAQSTCASAINNTQTTVTLQSASGFSAPAAGQQFSVVILDSGNPAYNANSPLATPYEYQQVNSVSGNVLTFGPGGGGASRVAFAGTTPRSFFAGAAIAQTMLAEDINASFPCKILSVLVGTDVSAPAASIRLPLSGLLPQNFTTLQLFVVARGDTAGSGGDIYRADLSMQFNGDAGNNYMFEYADFVTSTPTPNQIGSTSSISIGHVATASATATTPGTNRIEIPWYSGTTWIKQALGQSVRLDTGGSGHIRWGVWNSAAAITFITLRSVIGSFVAGSRFDLYGLP